MLNRTYEHQICSIARTLEIVGERWSLLIVRDALLGLRRFDEFQASLGIARNVLTDRLGRLVEAGVLARVPYWQRPLRHAYEPTDKGRELFPVLLALMHWGDRHLAGDAGPPQLVRHAGCGGAVVGQLTCARCGPIDAGAAEVLPYRPWPPINGRRQRADK
jgi:DNA-binding HxlR family transcriptional regulator